MSEGKHSRPYGPKTEFFLSANSQYKKGERIPIEVNGYKFEAEVGKRNALPAEVVEVLQNAKSRSYVPDVDKYNPDRGGKPRAQDGFFNPETRVEYHSDFDIEILKEGK